MGLNSIIKIYYYFDGNGNKYIINAETIEYIPIKPYNSSSGFYNGGDYLKKELNKTQYDYIVSILNLAAQNRKNHIKDRVKGSGFIIIQEKTREKSFILRPNSEEIQEIENSLQKIITN
ncbi:MAG: hypothetical protein ACFFA4_03775 [Promethearchaeota archaeon]